MLVVVDVNSFRFCFPKHGTAITVNMNILGERKKRDEKLIFLLVNYWVFGISSGRNRGMAT